MDTTTPHGELLFSIFGALAQYERALTRERVIAGLAAAKRRGRKGGRPPEEIVRERLGCDASLGNPGYRPPPDPCVLPKAMLVIECAKDVSQPDM